MPQENKFTTTELKQRTEALTICGNYDGFREFYVANKESIYDAIVNSFRILSETDTNLISLMVNATVEKVNWDTTFRLSVSRIDLLTHHILPYFTELEAYEKCAAIHSIIVQLKQKK